MSWLRDDTARPITPLAAAWRMAVAPAGAAATPQQAEALAGWRPALVPGTARQALEGTGPLSDDTPALHDHDVWYRCAVTFPHPVTLRFDGLTAPCEIFLDGESAAAVASMFVATEVPCGAGAHAIMLRFPALNPILATAKGPRARWRPMMIQPGSLRLVRTTVHGHTPWSRPMAVVGPWQPVWAVAASAEPALTGCRLRATYDDGGAVLEAEIAFDATPLGPVAVHCAGASMTLEVGPDGRHRGRMVVPGAAPWWPHSLGEPVTHAVQVRIGARVLHGGRIGFRSITLDRGPDGKGFGLVVNGVPLFCRGAIWTPPQPGAPGVGDARERLTLAREAGMTMIRLSGAIGPESRDFHDLCDELGLLVWYDLPFANFDYPTEDPAFAALIADEVRHLLGRLQGSPSLAVVSGGSEMAQQATMLGLTTAQAALPFFETRLAELVQETAPQAVYVPNSPWGGPLPFVTDEGVSHYFGVGAYRRPVEDARRSAVRFASECLAFAAVPSAASLAQQGVDPAAEDAWKAGIPRDTGADWDFEDVRDHYVQLLFGVDAAALRTNDSERWLALGRAAPAILMEMVFAEWRRARSSCRGGLVWLMGDMRPGAGWGLIDHLGEPKTTWHALRRAFQPLHLGLTDEGVNGLGVHVVNETRTARRATLTLAAYGDSLHPLARAERTVELPAGAAVSWSSHELLGRFFDITDAYRFGPRAHAATLARLEDAASGALLAEASHVLKGAAVTPAAIGLSARPTGDGAQPALVVSSERFARFVTIEDPAYRACDEGFCLAPGETRVVGLIRRPNAAPGRGRVTALNSHPVVYEHAA